MIWTLLLFTWTQALCLCIRELLDRTGLMDRDHQVAEPTSRAEGTETLSFLCLTVQEYLTTHAHDIRPESLPAPPRITCHPTPIVEIVRWASGIDHSIYPKNKVKRMQPELCMCRTREVDLLMELLPPRTWPRGTPSVLPFNPGWDVET